MDQFSALEKKFFCPRNSVRYKSKEQQAAPLFFDTSF